MRRYAFQGDGSKLRRGLAKRPEPALLSERDIAALAPALASERTSEGELPATWVVTASDGLFRAASRRSEHVEVAGGDEVLAAGEVWFAREKRWCVSRIDNRSLGYRIPLPESYEAVRAALAASGIAHARGSYDEVFVAAHCVEHGLQVLREGDVLECKVCFEPVLPLHV